MAAPVLVAPPAFLLGLLVLGGRLDDDMSAVAIPLPQLAERQEILHMLASVTSNAVYETLHDNRPADPAAIRHGLAALPESWELQRPISPRNVTPCSR